MITLTPEEQRILLNPTRIEEWGAQQKIAQEVQRQVLALDETEVMIDNTDIYLINKAIETNHEGAFIESGKSRAGGWGTTSWTVSTSLLKIAVQRMV